ncbi:hypothetical protein YTPLAS18_32860 [Nitrospira sp.]|nr:hypothetical protein YTPLAS18_32860 [Nitrospira sp.]
MNTVIAEFCHRVEGIPFHGVGLSADAYQPDFSEVMTALACRGCLPSFTELFRASTPMLASLRRSYPNLYMPYHAEGLWLTQPGWAKGCPPPFDLRLAAEHSRILDSAWLNHECATKVLAGFPLGTYLPPVFAEAVAEVTAEQSSYVQAVLDREGGARDGRGPLLLLELPPLTYFGAGNLSVAEFFRFIVDRIPCGLVMDIGHLWTHYRYGVRSEGESLERFVQRFLEAFPLDRVVEIHVAGLSEHAAVRKAEGAQEPRWLDAHAAPIPSVLFDMLDQVLAQPRLSALRGVALEVDTKSTTLIVDEFESFRQRYEPVLARRHGSLPTLQNSQDCGPFRWEAVAPDAGDVAEALEATYLDVVLGHRDPEQWREMMPVEPPCLSLYREHYLRHELLHWGGDLVDLFPVTCARLSEFGVPLEAFVPFWFAQRRPLPVSFDFFMLKLERFVEFVRERLPEAWPLAQDEAERMRSAYEQATTPMGRPAEVVQ